MTALTAASVARRPSETPSQPVLLHGGIPARFRATWTPHLSLSRLGDAVLANCGFM